MHDREVENTPLWLMFVGPMNTLLKLDTYLPDTVYEKQL